MISDDRLTKALKYLAETDEPAAQAKALMVGLEEQKKTVFGMEFMRAAGNNVAERDAKARTSEAYKAHIEKWQNAVADYELLRNKRSTEALVVEVWRSMNANRRSGNV